MKKRTPEPKRFSTPRFPKAAALCLLFALVMVRPSAPLAQDAVAPPAADRFELEELVVTGTGLEEEVKKLPRNITVITAEDIEQASSNNVADLLAREANVQLRSFFGHDKWSAVDIRGMGDTAVSNVLVMVDGVRLNPPDMAGPDLSSIPLDQIERIEILRGAASVRYGDGAVGGVINIITKKGRSDPEFRVRTSYGSYNTFDGRVSYGGRVNRFNFNLSFAHYDTDGYRDNGRIRKNDVAAQFGYDLTDWLALSVGVTNHRDQYGLPGPVKKEDLGKRDKRELTLRPWDSGETEDERCRAALEMDLGRYGLITAAAGLRARDNEYVVGYTPLLPRQDQTDHIDEDTQTLNMVYLKDFTVSGLPQQIQVGVDYMYSDYIRDERSYNRRHNSRVERLDFFATGRVGLPWHLTFHLGYRHSDFDGQFRVDRRRTFGTKRVWVNGDPYARHWNRDSFELGLVWAPDDNTSLFASYATSFRSPNVDEFAEADDDLHPQKGEHFELGARRRFGSLAEVSVTLFMTTIEDEIYYGEDPATGLPLNRNYDDRTVRTGVETDLKLYLLSNLYLWGNWTYMEARFQKTDAFVPLVPRYKASLGLEWNITDPLVLSLTGTVVGERFDGNDQNNTLYNKLGAYEVVDLKLIYRRNHFKFFAGVNNLFDRLYATTGYSETYYPMPTRNVYAGVELSF